MTAGSVIAFRALSSASTVVPTQSISRRHSRQPYGGRPHRQNCLQEVPRSHTAERLQDFTTVLGPGSDDFHKTHIHLDLIERKGGYRMCQWDVLTVPEAGSALPPEHAHASNGAK